MEKQNQVTDEGTKECCNHETKGHACKCAHDHIIRDGLFGSKKPSCIKDADSLSELHK